MSTISPTIVEQKSRITGALAEDPGRKIKFVGLGNRFQRFLTLLLAIAASGFCISFCVWLVTSALSSETLFQGAFTLPWALAWLFALVALSNELIRTPLILTLAYTAIMSKKPVPVLPHETLRMLLVIPFVPKSEDPKRLEKTLIAFKRMRSDSGETVAMVLDEGLEDGVSPVKALVARIKLQYPGTNKIVYFCRHDHRRYDKTHGKFKSGQKYGNINSGLHYVEYHPDEFGTFDVVAGIDHDHIPHPEFRERMIGYFNDPDIAYVVGPQSYENALTSFIARMAESCQSVFHVQIQAAPNKAGGPMFVGTSWLIRWTVLMQIGGIQASKTEDLKTTFAVLSRHNPQTKKYWRSVYTPDVLAHGEGPATFGDYYVQQKRWAGGAIALWRSPSYWLSLIQMWRRPVVLWHYLSIMAFYPIMGLSWLLAVTNLGLQMFLGADGQLVDPQVWMVFYAWVTFINVSLYIRMRRYNTSPFEKDGIRAALMGMLMGVMTIPIFFNALFTANRKFAVTPKGAKSNGDRPFTFRLNIVWLVLFALLLVAGWKGRTINPINLTWSLIAVAILLAPIVIWKLTAPRPAESKYVSNPLETLESWFEDIKLPPAEVNLSTLLLEESEA